MEPLSKKKAKKYFLENKCSHFYMSRGDWNYYSRYMASGVKEYESSWRDEEVEHHFETFPYDQPKTVAKAYSSLDSMISYNQEYLQKMLHLTKKILEMVMPEQVSIILQVITGNSNTPSHGGLIEKSYNIGEAEIANALVNCANDLVEVADQNKVKLLFCRGYLADCIEVLGIKGYDDQIKILRDSDHFESFNYYREGANNGNIFSMRMYGKFYAEGKGCEVDKDKAVYWLKKAANLGSEPAKKDLTDLMETSRSKKNNWFLRFLSQ